MNLTPEQQKRYDEMVKSQQNGTLSAPPKKQ
jgi:hypothetical protein